MGSAVIVDVVRTASGRGKPGGALSGFHPADLLATVLRSLVERNDLDAALVDDVIGGCVTQVGEQAVNVTRNAVLGAGFPHSVPATTVDRQCGSSQQATAFAAQGVLSGAYDVVIACGVELMSKNPINSGTLGRDPWGPLVHGRYPEGLVGQGISAELIAARWDLDRRALDEFSARSHRLATEAAARGDVEREILPVPVTDADGNERLHASDETVRPSTTVDGLAALKPAFVDEHTQRRFPEIDWRITPGNSSPLTDGASAALIMSEERAASLGLTPRARFVSFAVTGSDPIEMLTGVIPATRRILERSGLGIDDIDVFEVNEAFASVPLAWQRDLRANPGLVNRRGGAIAIGHALGSSGTRLLTTLVNELETSGGRYGLQVMCEGGGMANATLIERL